MGLIKKSTTDEISNITNLDFTINDFSKNEQDFNDDNFTFIKDLINDIYYISNNIPKKNIYLDKTTQDIVNVTYGGIFCNTDKSRYTSIRNEATEKYINSLRNYVITELIKIKCNYNINDIWVTFKDVSDNFSIFENLTPNTVISYQEDIYNILHLNEVFKLLTEKFYKILSITDLLNNSDYSEIVEHYKLSQDSFTKYLLTSIKDSSGDYIINQVTNKPYTFPKEFINYSLLQIYNYVVSVHYKTRPYIVLKLSDTFTIILGLDKGEKILAKRRSKQIFEDLLESANKEEVIPIEDIVSKNNYYRQNINYTEVNNEELINNKDTELIGHKYNENISSYQEVTKYENEIDYICLNKILNYLKEFNKPRFSSYSTPDLVLLQQGIITPDKSLEKIYSNTDKFNLYLDTSSSMEDKDLRIALKIGNTIYQHFNKDISVNEFNTQLTYNTLDKFKDKMYTIKSRGGTAIKLVLDDILRTKQKMNIIITDGDLDWNKVIDFKFHNSNYKLIFIITSRENYFSLLEDVYLHCNENLIILEP